MAQVLVFGASTTYGHYDTEGGWVQRLRTFIDGKMIAHHFEPYHVIYNLGVDGDDSKGVLNRLEGEIKDRIDDKNEVIILICIGINDSTVNEKTRQPIVSPSDYQKNLEEIIKKAKKYSGKIVMVGFFPVDKRVDPIPWWEGHSYKNEEIKMFEQIMESVANLNHVYFIPLFDKFSKDARKLLSDGVHPNSKGHEAIYEVVKEYLLQNKIISL